jgi:hypothetical protein
LFWIKPVGYGDIHLVANIYAFGKQLRDEGGHDAWRLDYNILVRVHNRFRKQLFNPQNAKSFLEGAHLGIIPPTRVTHVTYEDGTTQTFRDTWSPQERATELSHYWKGETQFEINVTTDTPLQIPYAPPPLQDQSTGSGLQADEASVGRQSARRENKEKTFGDFEEYCWNVFTRSQDENFTYQRALHFQ